MDTQQAVILLIDEWKRPTGFLGGLKLGNFDPEGLQRLLVVLDSIMIDEESQVDRKLVSLLWFIPIYLEWQKPRFTEQGEGVQEIQDAINRIMPRLYEILGVP